MSIDSFNSSTGNSGLASAREICVGDAAPSGNKGKLGKAMLVGDFLDREHKSSLVHQHGYLVLEEQREIANSLLTDLAQAQTHEQRMEFVTLALGSFYFYGAQDEADRLDEAVEVCRETLGKDPSHFMHCFAGLVEAALKYIREFPRRDLGHNGRQSQKEDGLRKAAIRFADAWNTKGPNRNGIA